MLCQDAVNGSTHVRILRLAHVEKCRWTHQSRFGHGIDHRTKRCRLPANWSADRFAAERSARAIYPAQHLSAVHKHTPKSLRVEKFQAGSNLRFGYRSALCAPMLQKCANPQCITSFRKLSEGKLFLLESEAAGSAVLKHWDGGVSRRIEYFWLCRECASSFTLAFDKGRGIRAVPLRKMPARKAPLPLATANAESA